MDLDWSAILGGRHEAPPLQSGVLTGMLTQESGTAIKRFIGTPRTHLQIEMGRINL